MLLSKTKFIQPSGIIEMYSKHTSIKKLVLRCVYWSDAVSHKGLLSLFSFCSATLFAFHTWMRRVQKAHKHSCQPYLLCAQVIALIFLIQPRLNEKWVGGGIDPWPHLSAPDLSLRKYSSRSVTLLSPLPTGLTVDTCTCSVHTLLVQYDNREENLNVDIEIAQYSLFNMLAQIVLCQEDCWLSEMFFTHQTYSVKAW